MVLRVWEDFSELVGGAGGGIVCDCEGGMGRGLHVARRQMETHGWPSARATELVCLDSFSAVWGFGEFCWQVNTVLQRKKTN